MTIPTTIMIQVIAAAAGLRVGVTRVASSASRDVPAAPTPAPIIMKATTASRVPNTTDVAIRAVALVASKAPSASTPIPPMIHGVRRRPRSDP